MIRNIYHGSSRIIRAPRFGAGYAYNDYGLGFYCTENLDLAAEWAVDRGANGYINRYTLNDEGLRTINLNSPQYCILHWLSVLISNREFDAPTAQVYQAKDYIQTAFRVDTQNCDCMIGYRADDTCFSIAQDFLSGDISYAQLRHALYLANAGRQFVLKSNRAFDRITFTGYEIAWSEERFPAKMARDRSARSGYYNKVVNVDDQSAGLYISDIVGEEITPYDPRLR